MQIIVSGFARSFRLPRKPKSLHRIKPGHIHLRGILDHLPPDRADQLAVTTDKLFQFPPPHLVVKRLLGGCHTGWTVTVKTFTFITLQITAEFSLTERRITRSGTYHPHQGKRRRTVTPGR